MKSPIIFFLIALLPFLSVGQNQNISNGDIFPVFRIGTSLSFKKQFA